MEGSYQRTFRLDRAAIDMEARTVELAAASEEPYRRWFGMEILGHKDSEVRLDRLKSGTHPLLLQHNDGKQIGVITKAWLQDGVLRSKVRFAPPTNSLAEEVWQDVAAGIRQLVSVGYEVHKWDKKLELDEDGGIDRSKTEYRAIDWEPFEISIVSVPADYKTVGIGKSKEKEFDMDEEEKKAKETAEAKKKADAELQTRAAAPPKQEDKPQPSENIEIIKERLRGEESQKLTRMFNMAAKHNCKDLLDEALKQGKTPEQFDRMILENMPEEPAMRQPEVRVNPNNRSIGELFIQSPQFKRWASGESESMRITLPFDRFYRATTSPSNVFNATTETLTSIQKLPGVPGMLDQQPIAVTSLFAQGTTTSTTIRYIQEDTFTNNATVTAEGSAKTEGKLDVDEVDASVYKCAVWLTVTDEMLSDHEQMRSFVDNRLAYMVGIKEDYFAINGSGSSQWYGLVNVSGINTVDASAAQVQADAVYQGITAIRSNGFVEPDAIVMHPNDFRDYRLSKDGNQQYHGGGPFYAPYGTGAFSNLGNMWGLPVVITTQITEGSVGIGAFRTAAQLWRRMGITLATTDSHEDDFVKNRMTIRAESRFALAWYKPKGFCLVSNVA